LWPPLRPIEGVSNYCHYIILFSVVSFLIQ